MFQSFICQRHRAGAARGARYGLSGCADFVELARAAKLDIEQAAASPPAVHHEYRRRNATGRPQDPSAIPVDDEDLSHVRPYRGIPLDISTPRRARQEADFDGQSHPRYRDSSAERKRTTL